jgi:hypothetical protein
MSWKNVIFCHLVEAFKYLIKKMESQEIELEYADNIVRLFSGPVNYVVLI